MRSRSAFNSWARPRSRPSQRRGFRQDGCRSRAGACFIVASHGGGSVARPLSVARGLRWKRKNPAARLGPSTPINPVCHHHLAASCRVEVWRSCRSVRTLRPSVEDAAHRVEGDHALSPEVQRPKDQGEHAGEAPKQLHPGQGIARVKGGDGKVAHGFIDAVGRQARNGRATARNVGAAPRWGQLPCRAYLPSVPKPPGRLRSVRESVT